MVWVLLQAHGDSQPPEVEILERSRGQTEEVIVIFEENQAGAAEEVAKVYPSVKSELVENLGWEVGFRPAVLMDRGGKTIRKNTGSEIFVAYAVPNRNLIVLDISRVYAKPFSLESTLKHELCHLLIHRNIENPPRWIDEGVCQWASGGIAEFVTEDGKRALHNATVSGGLIGIRKLVEFPPENMNLAYEESKSIVRTRSGRGGRTPGSRRYRPGG